MVRSLLATPLYAGSSISGWTWCRHKCYKYARPDILNRSILNRSGDFQYVLPRLAVMSSHAAGLDAMTQANRVCHAEEPRDMVPSTHNSQILNFLLGRPCVVLNVAVLDLIVAPGIAARNQQTVMHWSVLVGFSPVLLA